MLLPHMAAVASLCCCHVLSVVQCGVCAHSCSFCTEWLIVTAPCVGLCGCLTTQAGCWQRLDVALQLACYLQGDGELRGFLQERNGSQPLIVDRAARHSLVCCRNAPVGWSCVLKLKALYFCEGTLFGWAWAMQGQGQLACSRSVAAPGTSRSVAAPSTSVVSTLACRVVDCGEAVLAKGTSCDGTCAGQGAPIVSSLAFS